VVAVIQQQRQTAKLVGLLKAISGCWREIQDTTLVLTSARDVALLGLQRTGVATGLIELLTVT
jgi:hypothetical protein